MSEAQQYAASSITYIDDWTNRLAKAYPSSNITIASATGVASAGVLSAVSGTGKAVTFHLATSGLTPPQDVVVTLTATLSNSDIDVRKIEIGVA